MAIHEEIHNTIEALISEVVQQDNKWPRKAQEGYEDDYMEDLFACHRCNDWYPWFCFTRLAPKEGCDVYALMVDDESFRGTVRWACDTCFANVLVQERLILRTK